MSINDQITLLSRSAEETRAIAASLAKSLYRTPLTVLVAGELGTGKTVFAQGLGSALGVPAVLSPTYALEQRHSDRFLHLDLYRLKQPEAERLVSSSDEFLGVRLIEWPERVKTLASLPAPHIRIDIEDIDAERRRLYFAFHDATIPSVPQCRAWMDEVALPDNVRAHTAQVTRVALACADGLLERGAVIRREAVRAAADLHDLLRFVDFAASGSGPAPSLRQAARWQQLTAIYGQPHERAAERFLSERGCPEIAAIVLTHGPPREDIPKPETTEQLLLSYADKRVAFDRIVSVDERFDEFLRRYAKGEESASAKRWREEVKGIERRLFPEGPPL